jgi:carboxypeptidase C (cathepsin A)
MDKTAKPTRIPLMRSLLLLFLGSTLLATAAPDAPAKPEKRSENATEAARQPVVREAKVTIAGQEIPYKVTTGKLQLLEEDGKARASIFHVSYERSDVEDRSNRPVMFAFNGGPGSSAVWLHLGVLGPKRVDLPGDGTQPPQPPVRIIDNAFSILDVCDLVFIDPVSTGYSRMEGDAKAEDFHGLEGDIRSVGDFIRRWVTENDRWASPKHLLGESYGGIRAAGLAEHLQSRYGMSLNGVVLLSSLLDFRTLITSQGNDLAYSSFLPVYTGTAHFHGRIQGDRDSLVEESSRFAFKEYSAALVAGTALDTAVRDTVAAKLAELSGLPTEMWIRHNLRIHPSLFRAELLRDQGKVLGRFDGRVAWDAPSPADQLPDYDPSYSLALGAFSTGMLDYLGRDLGWKEERPYEILTSKVQPWKWGAENSIVNLSGRLATALRDNPHLRILVMGGYTDLATPPEGVAYSVRHMHNVPENLRQNITYTFYDAGHMFYLNPPDLEKTRTDLLEFLAPR